jgi:hypothetical protein
LVIGCSKLIKAAQYYCTLKTTHLTLQNMSSSQSTTTIGCGGLPFNSPNELALRQVLIEKYKTTKQPFTTPSLFQVVESQHHHHHYQPKSYQSSKDFCKDFPWCNETIWLEAIRTGILIPTSSSSSSSKSYSFLQDQDPFILNIQYIPNNNNNANNNLQTIITQLRTSVLKLFASFLSQDGTGVNYTELRQNPEPLILFNAIATQCSAIPILSLSQLPEIERKVFFLNLYNAMIIHAKVQLGNPNTIPERGIFFTKTAYRFDHIHNLTLDIVEHGILRANYPKNQSQGSILQGLNHPLLPLMLTQLDPRIHFALNCGAKSCPVIRAYTTSNIEQQLTNAATSFCSDPDNVSFDENTGITKLSKIFLWYGTDFTYYGTIQLVHAIALLLSPDSPLKTQLLTLAKDNKIVFNDYDWSENSHSV